MPPKYTYTITVQTKYPCGQLTAPSPLARVKYCPHSSANFRIGAVRPQQRNRKCVSRAVSELTKVLDRIQHVNET